MKVCKSSNLKSNFVVCIQFWSNKDWIRQRFDRESVELWEKIWFVPCPYYVPPLTSLSLSLSLYLYLSLSLTGTLTPPPRAQTRFSRIAQFSFFSREFPEPVSRFDRLRAFLGVRNFAASFLGFNGFEKTRFQKQSWMNHRFEKLLPRLFDFTNDFFLLSLKSHFNGIFTDSCLRVGEHVHC